VKTLFHVRELQTRLHEPNVSRNVNVKVLQIANMAHFAIFIPILPRKEYVILAHHPKIVVSHWDYLVRNMSVKWNASLAPRAHVKIIIIAIMTEEVMDSVKTVTT